MPKRPCLTCGALTSGSYCPAHSKEPKRERSQEPWRFLYGLAQWHRIRRYVLGRDGHQCVALVKGERCPVTQGLQVHHDPPLKTLWDRADTRADFIRMACDPAGLFSLCRSHHEMVEATH